MSEQWFSASEDVDSESDPEEKRDCVRERARSMSRGRGSVRPSDRPAQVGGDTPYVRESNPVIHPFEWVQLTDSWGICTSLIPQLLVDSDLRTSGGTNPYNNHTQSLSSLYPNTIYL
jgi:hypothetical protein